MFLNRFKIIRPAISIFINVKNGPNINRQVEFSTLKNKHAISNKLVLERKNILSNIYRLVHDDTCDHTFFDITSTSSSENLDDIFDDDDDDELEEGIDYTDSGISDEIGEFFTDRAIPYEEIEGIEEYFSAQCPVCLNKSNDKSVFVEKFSGVSFCPSCKFYGKWEELVAKYDLEDHLSKDQLDELFSSSSIITEEQLELLSLTPFSKFDIGTLIDAKARIHEDESHLIFPLTKDNDIVGIASYSLLHTKKSFKVVYQLLEGQLGIFHCKTRKRRHSDDVIIVSKISDCLSLSKSCNRDVICFTAAPSVKCIEFVLQDKKEIYLWVQEQLNENLVTYLKTQKDLNCLLIPFHEHRQDLSKRSARSVGSVLASAIPIFDTDVVKDYSSIQNEVFDAVRRKEEQIGTKWHRYHMLNEILHGHRPGELTIFTGLTGTGKTTFMSEYSLDLCMQGVPTLWGSFEVDHIRLINNMLQQYLGKPVPSHLFHFRKLSNEFSRIPMYTLAYYGQQTLASVLNPMAESVAAKGVRHVIIDNLQFMLGVNDRAVEWWLEQDRAVGAFRNFATKFNCHVTLIVHPKKLQNGEPFGLNNISGGARVTQEADNVMILQTKMKPNTVDTFAPKTLQIVKNRYGGTLGEMKLSFHKESKTFSSYFTKSNTPKSTSPYNKNGSTTDR